ncbi:MAG: lysophospholipid acyltransferase family protein [Muribaculaceae bacterium]|nr:lysophospholipid acyltransferase family protein [Muribaculaceae bacterium]
MKQVLDTILYWALYGGWYTLSLLPMWLHYALGRVLYLLLAYVLRYRHKVIDKNLAAAFPDMSDDERRRLRLSFYSFFCDYIAETVKFATMSRQDIERRMTFENAEQADELVKQGRSVALMLGHYGNWELVTSIRRCFTREDAGYGHLYHPLENAAMDRLFLTFRDRMGSKSVAMRDTLRWLTGHERAGRPTVLGYISDQVPLWTNIHYWLTFMNQETPVFTGVERISRKMRQAVFYVDVRVVKRGYYVARLVPITLDASQEPYHFVTDRYFELLEQTIRRAPQYWLWSHNRWKRTREEFERDWQVVNGRVVRRRP